MYFSYISVQHVLFGASKNVPEIATDERPLHMDKCMEVPLIVNQIAMNHVAVFANKSLQKLVIPNPGAERNIIGSVMSIVRDNMSVRNFAIERMRLQGCGGDTTDNLSWIDVLAGYVPDVSSWRHGESASIKARYLPDTIRVDLTGVRFTVAVRYNVYQLGVQTGSGTATLVCAGSLWLDGISLRLDDMHKEQGESSMGCGGVIAIERVMFSGAYHNTEGLYMEGGILRPDIVGYVCDGFETENQNPFATGWEWLGPGERAPGLRVIVARFIRTTCADSTPMERAVGRCALPYTWPVAALEVATVTWSDDPAGFSFCTFVTVYIIVYCVRLRGAAWRFF